MVVVYMLISFYMADNVDATKVMGWIYITSMTGWISLESGYFLVKDLLKNCKSQCLRKKQSAKKGLT